jgi:hypothetical protein
MEKNFGLKEGSTPRDWKAGAFSPLTLPVLTDDWTSYKPEKELQFIMSDPPFETSCCVSFATNNVIETLMMYRLRNNLVSKEDVLWLNQNGYFLNGFINFSDRFTAINGKTDKQGAYQFEVANGVKKCGLIPESLLPNKAKTYEEYMNPRAITPAMMVLGLEFAKRFPIYYQWIDDIEEGVKLSPLTCSVRYAQGEGILAPQGQQNHRVMIVKDFDAYAQILDSYWQEFKDYDKKCIYSPMGFYIIKNMDKFIPQDNKLYLLVEGPSQRLAMGLEGRLVIYNDKIDTLLNSASRSKSYQIPIPLTLEMWNSADKVDSKLNPL